MRTIIALPLTMILLNGCGSFRGPHQEYISPFISGRILDAQTGQPIVGARIERQSRQARTERPTEVHGATLLQSTRPAISAAGGAFELAGERVAHLLFDRGTVLGVTLRVSAPNYTTLSTNLDLVTSPPDSSSGKPILNGIELRLMPLSTTTAPPRPGPSQ
ncbi:MAG TPA: hypothetical protein VNO52_09935 [Methylomirabilota bacterium]|nr:hypothetical protein [Methylomirabilota bacterium]